MSGLEEIIGEATKARDTKQYELAVELFGEACGTYALAHDGQEDPDLLFQYGNALFDLGKANATLLNTENVNQTSRPVAVAGMDELEVVPEGEKSSKQLAAEQRVEMQSNQQKGIKEVEQEANSKQEASIETTENQNNDDAPEQADEADEEEVDDFTAAWQMIDLCRVLYSRELDITKDKKSVQNKLAEVYGLLGQISIEDDNYEQAAVDFQSALEIKEELLEPDNRLLSEAHFMLAIALDMKGDAIGDKKAALKHMQSAVDIAKKAGVDHQSIQDLRQKAHDLTKEVNSIASAPSASTEANPADRDSIISNMMDMLGGARDIGGLVKRKAHSDLTESSSEPKLFKSSDNVPKHGDEE